MKRLYLIAILILLAATLTGCAVLEERYRATAAKASAVRAEVQAEAQIAQAHAIETQAVQATAQVAQVEASNRLMAFLATLTTISQNNTVLAAAALIAAGLAAAAYIVVRSERR